MSQRVISIAAMHAFELIGAVGIDNTASSTQNGCP